MTFTEKTKSELLSGGFGSLEDQKAEAYAFLLLSSAFDKNSIIFDSENIDINLRLCMLLKNLVGATASVFERSGHKPYRLTVENEEERLKVLQFFGQENEINLKVDPQMIEEGSFPSFLKGAFLASGNLSNPEKSYRFELVIKHMALCISLLEYLSENNCFMSFSQRSGRFIVYTKDSSLIEDLLVLMGAGTSSLEIMNAKIYKDIRNKVNRVTNFENANIDKMVKSAEADCEAINYLLEHIDIGDISDELMAAATLRIENPDMSLSELCEIARPKVSRSGLYHRIKKLSAMAEEIRKREEG